MATRRMLIVQPSPFDPPGPLGEWLSVDGLITEVVQPASLSLPDDLGSYCALVCLGGVMGAADDAEHPWLEHMRQLFRAAVADAIPILGVCLGAQLLAVACGGSISRMPSPEIGICPLLIPGKTIDDPLLAHVPDRLPSLQFHRDDISELPPASISFAHTTASSNQIFRIGRNAYGLQFHVETTPNMLANWLDGVPDISEHANRQEFEIASLRAAHQTWAPIWSRFARAFATAVTK
ncbi:MAG: type 1 glutamine amidotransferase [Chloroflexi bacterium]|nr:type 1 glutamine amidotransferase [Chloroflexota bacterium]